MAGVLQKETNQKNLHNYSDFPRLEQICLRKVMLKAHISFNGVSLKDHYETVTNPYIEEWLKKYYHLSKLPKNLRTYEVDFGIKCLQYELHHWRVKIQWIKNWDRITVNEVAWTPFGKINEEGTFFKLRHLITVKEAFIYASKLCLKNYLLGIPRDVRTNILNEYAYMDCVHFWAKYCEIELGEVDDDRFVLRGYRRAKPSLKQMLTEAINFEGVSSVSFIWNNLIQSEDDSGPFRFLLTHNIVANEEICAFFVMNLPEAQQIEMFDFYNKQSILFALVRLWPWQNLIPSVLRRLHAWSKLTTSEFYQFCSLLLLNCLMTNYPVYERRLELFQEVWAEFSDLFVVSCPFSIHDLVNLLYNLFEQGNFAAMETITESEAYVRLRKDLLFGESAKQKYYFVLYRGFDLNTFLEFLGCTKSDIQQIWDRYENEFKWMQDVNVNTSKHRRFSKFECNVC